MAWLQWERETTLIGYSGQEDKWPGYSVTGVKLSVRSGQRVNKSCSWTETYMDWLQRHREYKRTTWIGAETGGYS